MNELAPTMVPASNSHCTLAEVQQVLDAGTRVGAAHALQTCVCVCGGGGTGGGGGSCLSTETILLYTAGPMVAHVPFKLKLKALQYTMLRKTLAMAVPWLPSAGIHDRLLKRYGQV